jgi:methylenetetrahydrofolate reductase (NADPH)
MKTAVPISQQPPPADPAARIAAFMTGFSIEVTRPADADLTALGGLERGTRVYLSALPNRPTDEAVATVTRLRKSGLQPVPHIAVRNFASVPSLDDFLARLNGEAGVDRVLVIAGDRSECGPFRCARDAIDSGLLPRRGIRIVGIAGYPEGHPRIGDEELKRALSEKITAAEAVGLTVEIVTQFCFNYRAIIDFVARLRDFGFDHRVRVGLAGPTNLTSLMRYASRCGVRASTQALTQRSGLMRQMFTTTAPDDLIVALAEAAPGGVEPHFFSFGGIPATARWVRSVAEGHITLEPGGGFRVVAPAAEG